MQTVHWSVSGMPNNKSKAKLLNALDKIKGVQKVDVDLARGTVEVEYNDPANPSSIRECIEHTGYNVED